MKVRIRKVPLTGCLEGIDLRHYNFCPGHIYEIGPRLAELLIVSGYAEPARRRDDYDQADDKGSPRD